ncbi:MAG: TonB-dependent receptor [Deltaproteobacteria bacterium]|nr:TonB-dependent receptor [Deltaproteobacteria bacterium]
MRGVSKSEMIPTICALAAAISLLIAPHRANGADLSELDWEQLLDIEVISASRRLQKSSEAPGAIYVITHKDINRSGATCIPDVLRMVPGIDVANYYGNNYSVTARGLNEPFARRMLILVDGRSIYSPFYGAAYWENPQVFLEDIKQIEVMRGPGATLWGANAVNGVVNIITWDPEEKPGLSVTTRAGTKQFRETVLRLSGPLSKNLHGTITAGYHDDQGTRGVHDFRRMPRATARLKYALSEQSTLHLFAGFNEMTEYAIPYTANAPETDMRLRANFQMLRWEHRHSQTSNFHLQLYHSNFEANSTLKFFETECDTNEIELQHSFAAGDHHLILWGGNYRSSEARSSYLDAYNDHDDLVGFFVQDEIRVLDSLTVVGGVKFENNSFTGSDWSPRLSVLYTPAFDHQLRLTWSQAYRTPSFIENGMLMNSTFPPPLQQIPLATINGNRHLSTEKNTAWELGYRTTLFHKIKLNVELYYNNLKNLIEYHTNTSRLPADIQFRNNYNAVSMGTEIDLRFPVTSRWMLSANYTYQEVENKRAERDVNATPRHKVNVESHYLFQNGISLNIRAHFVAETKWRDPSGGLLNRFTIDDYLRLDVRIAKKFFNNHLELAAVGQNLTDKLHPEGTEGFTVFESDRLIYFQATWQYP